MVMSRVWRGTISWQTRNVKVKSLITPESNLADWLNYVSIYRHFTLGNSVNIFALNSYSHTNSIIPTSGNLNVLWT